MCYVFYLLGVCSIRTKARAIGWCEYEAMMHAFWAGLSLTFTHVRSARMLSFYETSTSSLPDKKKILLAARSNSKNQKRQLLHNEIKRKKM